MIKLFCVATCFSVWLLVACSHPTRDFDQEAAESGYIKQLVQGIAFQHAVYINGKPGSSDRIYVYLHGDGSPWINRSHISEDPTPRYPLTLKLMHKGPQPAIYLGRPCYHGQARLPECKQRYWTSARYSDAVVVSMRAALRRLLTHYPEIKITLVGYSGGGTLAVLMAAEFAEVDQLVTLAGNLDTDAWATLHHYSPLFESLNPVLQAPLPATIRQNHFAGELDKNVPISMIQKFANNQHHAKVTSLPDFTHKCCWEQFWPQLLDQLR